MATVEQLASKLNLYLKKFGKTKGKVWKTHVRAILQTTFNTLNQVPKPTPDVLKQLLEQLENEIQIAESPEPFETSPEMLSKPVAEPATQTEMPPDKKPAAQTEISPVAAETTAEPEAPPETAPENQANPETAEQKSGDAAKPEKPEDQILGYFQMVSIRVHEAFHLKAYRDPVRPFGTRGRKASKQADIICDRVDKFLAVLSKDSETKPAPETYVGYRDDLIKDMPERSLILRKKPKK